MPAKIEHFRHESDIYGLASAIENELARTRSLVSWSSIANTHHILNKDKRVVIVYFTKFFLTNDKVSYYFYHLFKRNLYQLKNNITICQHWVYAIASTRLFLKIPTNFSQQYTCKVEGWPNNSVRTSIITFTITIKFEQSQKLNVINLFIKLLYDHVGGNKNAKYLKYAIGEAVLVLIGILSALQINNWNEINRIKQQ